jgi:hypothetical protein
MQLTSPRTYAVDHHVDDSLVFRLRSNMLEGDVDLDPTARLTGWVLFHESEPIQTTVRARLSSSSQAGAQDIELRESPRLNERFPDSPGSDRAKFEIRLGNIWTSEIYAHEPFELELMTKVSGRPQVFSTWKFQPLTPEMASADW